MLAMATSNDPEVRRRKFGEALRDAMRVKDVTQEELAERIQQSQPAVSGWINGTNAPKTVEIAFEIERALGVDPGSLTVHLGYLPPEALKTVASFEGVLLADPALTADEKEMLLAAYKSARKRARGRKR